MTFAVTLLGTGGPVPAPDRAGPSTLVSVDTDHYLVDAGRGVLMRLASVGVGAANLTAVLVTHLHSDHITDLNDVITTRWITTFEPTPLTVVGPVGTRTVVDHLLAALAPDIAYRIAHHADLDGPPLVDVVEVADGPVDAPGSASLSCAPTDHKPVEPSVGYRFEHDGAAVVVAGDTVPCVGLDRLCDGADALVHTVIRKDVIAAMKELKLSVVRWPGGCFASGYHWKDGVGQRRTPTPDPVWGVTDPNTFGTDEFVQWCRLVGCEPYICTNAGSGDPEEMRQWVEYCNASEGRSATLRKVGGNKQPFAVKFWSIGNENWGGHEIGASTPADWGPLVVRSAKQMLTVDPHLKLAAAATSDRAWTLPLLRAAGDHLDYVAVHQYWLGNWQHNATPDYLTCIMHSEDPDRTIAGVIATLEESGYRGRIKIAFDEWNLRGWHHPGFPRKQAIDPSDKAAAALIAKRDLNAIASQYTMADAIFSASFLNACLRNAQDVGMANIAPIVNTRGPLYVHPEGVVKRTTFHTLAMYANALQSRVGKVDVQAGRLYRGDRSVSVIDAIATVDEAARHWSLALVNRHPSKEVVCTIKFQDARLNGEYAATILAGDSPDAYNDVERPSRVVPIETRLLFEKGVVKLAPHSLTIVREEERE